MKAVILNSRPVAQVARELSINEGTLGNWVAAYRRDHADEEPALDVSEQPDCAKLNGWSGSLIHKLRRRIGR